MEFKNYVINGVEVKHREKEEAVLMPTQFNEREEYFRGAWVTSLCDDFKPVPDKEQMKANLLNVLSYFEKMNLNAIIFHVRTNNNAFYKTKYAPIDPRYGTYDSFDEFDYLKWFIEECHNRGIEFHAWLNPYRIKGAGFPKEYKEEDIAKLYSEYPLNPAKDASNILLNDATGAILNPCKEVVQKHIIDVCLELMENYNIDAIHFDDYFYAKMTEANEVLVEDDQKDYIEYIKNNPMNNVTRDLRKNEKEKEIDFWEKEEFDKFIECMNDPIQHAFFSTLYYMGLRKGECQALTWNDVDFNNKTITINKIVSHKHFKGENPITTPKTKNSYRTISMPDVLTGELRVLYSIERDFKAFREDSFVFGVNRWIPSETLRRTLKKGIEKANVKYITIHGFRHSHASYLINNMGKNNYSDYDIAQRLGDTVETLHRVYAHWFVKKDKEIIDFMNKNE